MKRRIKATRRISLMSNGGSFSAAAIASLVVAVGSTCFVWRTLAQLPQKEQVQVSSPQIAMAVKKGFTLTVNQPHVADRARLEFYSPVEVIAGAEQFENYASFRVYKSSPDQSFVRVGIRQSGKMGEVKDYYVDCLVTGSTAQAGSQFELLADGHGFHFPVEKQSQHLKFQYEAKGYPWSEVSIAANVPWTFHSCTVTPL